MPTHNQLLAEGDFLLERSPEKGSWTYIILPALPKGVSGQWLKVSGSMDTIALEHCNLMPMRDGRWFFPVKAAIRKQLQKEAGATVHLSLYADEPLLEAPAALPELLQLFPGTWETFQKLSDAEKNQWTEKIYNQPNDLKQEKALNELIDFLLPR